MVVGIGVRRVHSCAEHGLISINAVVDYQRRDNDPKEER